MSEVRGTVYKVYEKNFGDNMSYSIKLEDDTNYYRAGKYKPKVVSGQQVSITYSERNNNRYVDKVKLLDGDEAPEKPKSPGTPPPQPPRDWDAKDKKISYLAARNTAVDWVKFLHGAGALTVPDDKRLATGVLDTYLDSYTTKFFADGDNFGSVARMTPKAPKDPAPKAPEPTEDESEDD